MLLNSGIDFKQHQERGIDVNEFGELLISSGMILVGEVTWISFHRYACFCSLVATTLATF